MVSMHDEEPDVAPGSSGGELSNDYELRHILSVASAYLDAGQVADAEDLLQEAMDADPNNMAVQSLATRLAHIRGVPEPGRGGDSELIVTSPSDVLLHFTSPLPGSSTQSPAVQRLTRASEQDFNSDRIFSALDLTQMMCAEAPAYLPGFVRLAEIQLALGKVDQARDLYDNLKRRYEIDGEQAPWLVEALGIALNPGDTSALIGYAMTLIEAGEVSALDPFVPEAISRAVDMNVDAALNLADAYLKLKPACEHAQRLYLRVAAASGNLNGLVESARSMVNTASPVDLLAQRALAEMIATDGDWLPWLERVLEDVRLHPETGQDIRGLLSTSPLPHTDPRFVLAAALVLNACNCWRESLDILDSAVDAGAASPVEQFAALYARAVALGHLQHPDASSATLEAAQMAYNAEIETFARGTTVFGVSAAPEKILENFVYSGTGDRPLEALTKLRAENPGRLDIRSALAEAYLEAGKTLDGIKELRFVAEAHESSGNLAGMIEALRNISRAVPENVEMKAKLIEGYLRRGLLDQAVDELESIGNLYEARGKRQEAVAAFTRAAEISSALEDFVRGTALFDRAVNTDADNVPVRHAAIAFYLQTGSIERAAEQLREVVRIALACDDKDEAVAALHQIIALEPHDPGAYHSLGEVLTSLGEYTQAERVYRRLASFTPHDPVLEAKQSALAVLAATR